MDIKGIIAVGFGIFVVIMIALTGAFSEIIKGFTAAMGIYGFIAGILLCLIIIIAIWQATSGGGRRR